MDETVQRMTDGSKEPDAGSLASWLGSVHYKRWIRLCRHIEDNYPGVFEPDWIFGGKKYGWGFRFKKSKSFCTLIPERNKLVVQIVFGAEERKKAESILDTLSPDVRGAYMKAPTYHDGKWLALSIHQNEILTDIKKLLAVKRRPTPAANHKRGRWTKRE